MGGGEGKKKKESKKGSRQPSAEQQPEPAAEAGGIRDWPDDGDDDDDRWGSECFKCGQDGDLLCCEVRFSSSAGGGALRWSTDPGSLRRAQRGSC